MDKICILLNFVILKRLGIVRTAPGFKGPSYVTRTSEIFDLKTEF
jgi:hypothetical protein